MEIIKKSSPELYGEFSESIFTTVGIYKDAIIGISVDGKIVFDFFRMHHLLEEDIITRNGNYENHFIDENHCMDYIHEKVCRTISKIQTEYGETAPIFCSDINFLNNIYPTLLENQTAVFNE